MGVVRQVEKGMPQAINMISFLDSDPTDYIPGAIGEMPHYG
jgi:hypothetical protein